MPAFCRHNRILENCPICSKRPGEQVSTRSAPRRPDKDPSSPRRAPRKSTAGGMTVRRVTRAPEDGYEHDLVPGLRSSADAARLADELAFSAARLRELQESPPGLYAEIAGAADREEAAWLAFLIAWLAPLEDGADDPFASIAAVRTTWASGELPGTEGLRGGPRTAFSAKHGIEALPAYRAWAQRLGGQVAALAGEESWTPQHRYDRAFERLAFPGFGRAQRIEFLVSAGRLGLVELDPWTLHLGAASALDPVAIAAKRILGIGDPVLLQRRQHELSSGVGVPNDALDVALYNFSAPSESERVTLGSRATVDPAERAAIAAALGVVAVEPTDAEVDVDAEAEG
jgi:hypothetical protein